MIEVKVEDRRVEGEVGEKVFRAELVAYRDGEAERRMPVAWRLAGPRTRTEDVQRYVDRQKERLRTELESAETFDPQAIT